MFGAVTIAGWRPGIGDPSVWGWLTVANYALAFVMTARAARSHESDTRFWTWTAAAMLALGVNKQLDLQSLLTAIGKKTAIDYGWYDHRFLVQKLFIYAICVALAAVMAFMWFVYRRSGAAVAVAISGLCMLSAFVAARAASFHHMDQFLNLRVLALRMNHVLENLGIGVIAVSAAFAGRPRKTKAP